MRERPRQAAWCAGARAVGGGQAKASGVRRARATQSHQGRLRVGWRIGWRREAAAASCGVSGSRDCGGNHDGDSWRS